MNQSRRGFMNRTKLLQETRLIRFEDTHQDWLIGRLTQEEAAWLLGVRDRTFCRYMARYEENGVDGLLDNRLSTVSLSSFIAVFMSIPTVSAMPSKPFSIKSSIARSNWVHSGLQVIVFSFLFVSAKNESERIYDDLLLPSLIRIYRKKGTLTQKRFRHT
jgi:hypothetical protein